MTVLALYSRVQGDLSRPIVGSISCFILSEQSIIIVKFVTNLNEPS